METHHGRVIPAIVRSVGALRALAATDPYRPFGPAPGAKRVVTFLRGRPNANVALPIERDGTRILCRKGGEVFTVYVRSPRGPVFMTLIERTFGKDVTTRTWETVLKVAR